MWACPHFDVKLRIIRKLHIDGGKGVCAGEPDVMMLLSSAACSLGTSTSTAPGTDTSTSQV